MQINLKANPKDILIQTDRTALIVVDMQNAFCKKGGLFDSMGKLDEVRIRPVIATNRQVIDAARAKGIKIIYLAMGYRPDLADAGGPDSPNYWKEGAIAAMREHPELRGKCLTVGSWDAQVIDELKPGAEDIVVNKNRFSGFANTGLDGILRNNSVRFLVFTGVFTNVCVESTLRDAFFREYFPVLVSDACGNAGPDFTQQATIWNVKHTFGWVTGSTDLLKALKINIY